MHYFTPQRCAATHKIIYHDRGQAQRAADRCLLERDVELWTYRCDLCGSWHLTHRDPSLHYAAGAKRRDSKPRSRKRGYKPRQR
ncbi:hypothetical protein CRD60_07265 [Bifidobacterium aemilianum]|uniref:Uncharacterized protein n=1 Tax=Bifidobacterium aemilianum TaxID=2493120 RepID=A0A366K9J9_9BIFI|nr:hypothetical protein [Bifidobacterium aemilianum]RBP97331.1 hypothetical protein CRD60_07265 [Bifidobacterium aemilianum]